MFDTFNISKMIITRKTKGEDDVSIIQSPKAEDNSYILIIRALDVAQKNQCLIKDINNRSVYPQALE